MIRIVWETCRWPLILLSLWMITLTGINSIPLEEHEILVLQTSREMELSGDWVLPSCNYEPRLKKPPFSYWATAMLSRLDPFSDDVQAWHGRLISLLAGLLMVFATYHAGKTFFDPAIGKLASVLMLSMQGYITFSHDARPDFLYSTFCALQLFAWMYAWKAKDGTIRQRLYGWLGWGMAGLAMLTKGPQGPVVFLVGMLAFLLCGSDRKRTFKVIRPFAGIAIFCLLFLPWWLLLQQRLTEMHVNLSKTQLSGSLLKNLAGWKELISFYYPLSLFWEMIPVSLIIFPLIPRLWKIREEMSAPTRILLYASAAMIIIFTLGGHYRKHYLLQVLPAFSIFLASAVQTVAFPRLQGMWKRSIMVLVALFAVLCLWQIIHDKGYLSLLWIFLMSIPLGFLLCQEMNDSTWADGLFSTQLLKTSVVLVIIVTSCIAYLPLSNHLSNHRQWRVSKQLLAESIEKNIHDGDLIVQWRTSKETIIPFCTKRPVKRFNAETKLASYFQENQGKHMMYVVIRKFDLPGFSAHFENDILITIENKRDPNRSLVFAKLTSLKNAQP